MDVFSISDLQQYSGVKAHTIRIWEQRYNALKPHRTEGNTRFYDGTQLRRLLNIVSLMDSEFKVSELCSMTDIEHFKLIDERMKFASLENPHYNDFVNQLISSGMAYNETHFEKTFSNCLLRFGMRETYLEIVYPMLVTLGLMWSKSSLMPSQDHFISNLVRQKLLTAVDALPPPVSDENAWLLYLPENELHEIGLLFANYLLRSSGVKVIYLGANLPFDALKHAVNEAKPSNLLFFFIHLDSPENIQNYINTLSTEFSETKLYISGNVQLINMLKLEKKAKHLDSVGTLEGIIKENKKRLTKI